MSENSLRYRFSKTSGFVAWIVGASLVSFSTDQVFAAIPPNASSSVLGSGETAIKFFKNPQALFASGETSRRNLEKNLRKEHLESNYLVRRGPQMFWTNSSSVVRALQLSELVQSQSLNKTLRVKDMTSYQANLVDENGNEFISNLKDLTPVNTDLGLAMNLIPTQIRQFPSWKSDSLISLPAGSRLQIIRFDDTWALVNFESVGKISGWVDMSNLLLKFDFAAFVQKKNRADWIPVSYRQGSDIISKEGEKIAITSIGGIMTKPDLVIAIANEEKNQLAIRQNLTIIDYDAEPWNVSEIKDFGLVYWKKNSQQTILEKTSTKNVFATEDILKKEIFSSSFHPTKSNFGIVSAQGVFVTEDGSQWRQLPQFKNNNHPVYVDGDGNLLVGNLRSADNGRSFHPYFRWEPLAQLLENRQKSPAYRLKIKNISQLKPGFLRFEVETQKGHIFLAAKIEKGFINHWNFD